MRVFATPERQRLRRQPGCGSAGPSPNLLGRKSLSPIREILHGPRGQHVVQNLDTEEPTRRRVHERLPGETGGREKKAPPKGGRAAPACRYKKISFSYYDAAWQDFPVKSGGGKELGPFVSLKDAWAAGTGIMKYRFVVTVDVDGDPNLCGYKQENTFRTAIHAGTPYEVATGQPRHTDNYPKSSPWIRFFDSKIQWMDSPGIADLHENEPPVQQSWTFWFSAWDSDGSGPLVLELSYDFTAEAAGTPWSVTYKPSLTASVSR